VLRLLIVCAAVAVCCEASAAARSADATAKLLAGLSIEGTALADDVSQWTAAEHASQMEKAWAQVERRQLANIRQWGPQFLGARYEDEAPMFYMFSGPDFLYANAFFPYARTYILCGIEPVGALPDVTRIAPQLLPSALANLRKSMESVLSFSFFITKNMKTDLNQTQLNGTLPVLYVFLARAGYTIDSVELVALDRTGNFAAAGKGSTPGVRIDFSSDEAGRQTLYYFCSDLSDWAVKSNPGFMNFLEAQGRGLTLLKAASYLMHGPNFDRVRQFLMNNSSVILQDDSGIPFRYFDPDEWILRYCGRYVGPIELFKQHVQPDFAQAFNATTPVPLTFGFGYQWQPNRSSLLIAQPRVSRALPPEEEPEEPSVRERAPVPMPDDDDA
jgi:hypothetical protein